jgi:hypothetical protein
MIILYTEYVRTQKVLYTRPDLKRIGIPWISASTRQPDSDFPTEWINNRLYTVRLRPQAVIVAQYWISLILNNDSNYY